MQSSCKKNMNEYYDKACLTDTALVRSTTYWMRGLFFMTNLAYWWLACSYRFMSMNFIFTSMIAAASTTMHLSQTRLCLCTLTERYHRRNFHSWYQIMDISIATSAVMYFISCIDSQGKFINAFFTLGLFFAGDWYKQNKRFHLYMFFHGAWHIATSAFMYSIMK